LTGTLACAVGPASWHDAAPAEPMPAADAGSQTPETVSGPPYPCPALYAQDHVPLFAIEIDPAEWRALEAEYRGWREREAAGLPLKPYHPLKAFRYERSIVSTAQIRLKGTPVHGWVGDKMQFQISFNEHDKDGRFLGLRKIVLDGPPNDPSLLRDRVAYSLLRDLGYPAPCANHARLEVNGVFYGVYTNIEKPDREFLERNFDDPSGNLYKEGTELKTNEAEGDTRRMQELWAAADVASLERLMDLDQAVSEWAAEGVLPNADGFWRGTMNFYLYDHPSRGFVFIPWDWDRAFDRAPVEAIPTFDPAVQERVQPHLRLVLEDPVWSRRYLDAAARVIERYDPDVLEARVDAWAAQIADAVAAEPHRPFSIETHERAVASLRAYFRARVAFLGGWLAGQRRTRTAGTTRASTRRRRARPDARWR
jgi:hypothetical protein